MYICICICIHIREGAGQRGLVIYKGVMIGVVIKIIVVSNFKLRGWSFKKKVVRLRTLGTGFHRSGTA